MFVIAFTTNNAAFTDDDRGEIASILNQVKLDILQNQMVDGATIRDRNGNSVGFWRYDAK